MKAHLSSTKWGGALVAQLETGARILANNPVKLAEQLRLAGVTAEELTVTRWTDNLEHAPATGHVIAIKSALNKASQLSVAEIERVLMNDDGLAAKQHLAAGRPIYYGDPQYPEGIVKKYPDDRKELVSVSAKGEIVLIREL